MIDSEARADSERIDALLAELSTESPEVRARVEEVVQRLIGLYGAAFRRLIEHVDAEGLGLRLRPRLLGDELVASLLMLHGLHPEGRDDGLVQVDVDRSRRGARRHPRARDHGEAAACELCAVPIRETHRHVVDTVDRGVRCACPACALLFQHAASERYRTVPDRVLVDPELDLSPAEWSGLGVPVHLAFVFFSTASDEWVATFPSPAGPTEAELDPEAWAALATRSALFDELTPDVEALLVHGPRGATRLECLLVPVDVCYRLVGAVRQHWRGFDGGDEARAEIESLLAGLRQRSRPLVQPEEAA